MWHKNESKTFRLSGYFLIVFSNVAALYKFITFFDDKIALLLMLMVFILLPVGTLMYTEGHTS